MSITTQHGLAAIKRWTTFFRACQKKFSRSFVITIKSFSSSNVRLHRASGARARKSAELQSIEQHFLARMVDKTGLPDQETPCVRLQLSRGKREGPMHVSHMNSCRQNSPSALVFCAATSNSTADLYVLEK